MFSLLKNKKILAWTFYDFADTALAALFFTFFWPLLIKEHLGGNEFHIGLVMGLSLFFVALFVPLIGAISDATGRRMPLLIISTVLTALFAVLTGYMGLIGALILGFLVRLMFTIDINLYNVKLVDLVERSKIGFVSGLGVGMGYLGAIAGLAVAYPLLEHFGWDTLVGIQVIFIEGALFLLIFSLPLFLLVKDQPLKEKVPLLSAFRKALRELKFTITNIKQFPAFGKFLLASFIYNDAVNTTLIFLVLYATSVIGLEIKEFFFVFVLMTLGAGIGALVFGYLSGRFGPKRTLTIVLAMWIFVILYLLFVKTFASILIAGIIGGAALGGTWTANRHMVTLISPYRKIAEFFGLEGMTERLSGILGPVVFGAIVVTIGYQAALFFILFLFILGFILLQRVPLKT
ncbi:MFS transporter [Patescibacteria group bacterium]|nr:MFS transporter [Patescibacteria group bacterium]